MNSSLCQCCASTQDLRSVSEPYTYYGESEVYSQMLSACFIDVSITDGFICGLCVRRLRAALTFKQCVESTKILLSSSRKENVKSSTFHNLAFMSQNSEGQSSIINCEIDSFSESSDDHFDDFFKVGQEIQQRINEDFDIGEQRTLPYVLDSTDRKCEICHKEFSFLGELIKHMPEHYPNYICEVCGKICVTRRSLVFHIKSHNDTRFECDLCDKHFKNKSNLNSHIKVQHNGQKIIFKCSQCGEKLNTYNARVKHMSEKHGREEKAYKCPQCNCKYRLSSHLRAHIRRVHLQEKNYKCEICGCSFFSKKTLENHNLKHTGEKKFLCQICNKGFGRKETLKLHSKSHEIRDYVPNLLQNLSDHDFE